MKREGKRINKKFIIFGAITIVIAGAIILYFGFFNQRVSEGPQGGFQCDVAPGEWIPQQGECQNNQSLQNKCNDFCSKHPDCCPGWNGNYTSSLGGPGETLLPWPSESDVNSLTRNYVTIIKAIDEGPLIYQTSETQKIISDEELGNMKATGFNTVQIMLIGKWEGDKIVFNEVNNRVLLNDIVAIKKKGMAVWVAMDLGGGSPNSGKKLADSYEIFKPAYMNLVNLSSPLMEEYKVEYLTVNNEADMFFNLQTTWGDKSQINNNLVDFYPATIELARKSFNGKIINKMTGPDIRTPEFLAATFENVDIAGVDVGPYIGDNFDMSIYQEGLNDGFPLYAAKAAAAGVEWMNAEYWLSDFGESRTAPKEHQLECVNAAFNSYLNATPKGVGYTYNEFATFSWQPDGEATRLAMKEFLGKI